MAQRVKGDLSLADTSALHLITLSQGAGKLKGHILAMNGQRLLLRRQGDTLALPIDQIKLIEVVSSKQQSHIYRLAAAAHHFLLPSARPMPHKSAAYHNVMIYFNEIQWQFGTHWSGTVATAGILLGGGISAKYSYRLAPQLYAAAIAKGGLVFFSSDLSAWMVGSVATFGDEQHYFSTGLLYGGASSAFFNDGQPRRFWTFTAAGTYPVGQYASLYVELVGEKVLIMGWRRVKKGKEFSAALVHTFRLLPLNPFLLPNSPAIWYPLPLVGFKMYF